MARKIPPLSATQIDKASPKDKEYNLADGNGLMLRVKPNGSKLWIFNYQRPYTKKRANISFGKYPELSLASARDKRNEARELLAREIDPKEHKEEIEAKNKTANENTFKQITLRWHEVKKSTVSADHAEDILRSFELHLFNKLGNIPLHKINAPKVIEILQPKAASSLETTKRLCQRINEVMAYAVNTGIIHHNPLSGISKAFEAPKKKHYPTIPPSQLPELMKDLSRASIKLTTRHLIEWQLHTMVRPSEAAETRWEEIDFEKALWNIPLDRMKKDRSHTVPLSAQAISLLDSISPISAHLEHVFPADRDPQKHTNPSTTNMALKRMGYHNRLVAHGLRSIGSTALNEEGFDPDLIEVALAHVDKNEVRAAYNRAEYIERRRKMMEWWSDFIEKAATGNMSLSSGTRGLRVINT